MKNEIHRIEARYDFTEEELNAFGPIIAHLNQAIHHKEQEKKSVASQYKAQIDNLRKDFNDNCNKLTSGYEMREMRTRLIKNYATKEREYYSLDTFACVKKEPFKPSDFQRDIDDDVDVSPEFGAVTDPTPAPQGTAETNPKLYTHLIRELNYWREQLELLPQSDDMPDDQIDRGLKMTAKITELEATLKGMEPEPPVKVESDKEQTDGAELSQEEQEAIGQAQGNDEQSGASDDDDDDDSVE